LAIERVAEAALAMKAGLDGAAERWGAGRQWARAVPSAMWPALLHLAGRDIAKGAELSPFGKRWRMFSAALLRRL